VEKSVWEIKTCVNRVQWLMPIIPTTQKVESRRFVVRGQSGKKVSETPSQPTAWCSSMHLSPKVTQEAEIGRTMDLGEPR
jgi:hypothetical protein